MNHQPRFIAGACSCSWPLNQKENLKKEMSNLQVTRSTSRERSPKWYVMKNRTDCVWTHGFVLPSGLTGSCSPLNNFSKSSFEIASVYVAWLAPHLPWQCASKRQQESDSHPQSRHRCRYFWSNRKAVACRCLLRPTGSVKHSDSNLVEAGELTDKKTLRWI